MRGATLYKGDIPFAMPTRHKQQHSTSTLRILRPRCLYIYTENTHVRIDTTLPPRQSFRRRHSRDSNCTAWIARAASPREMKSNNTITKYANFLEDSDCDVAFGNLCFFATIDGSMTHARVSCEFLGCRPPILGMVARFLGSRPPLLGMLAWFSGCRPPILWMAARPHRAHTFSTTDHPLCEQGG